MVAHYDDHYDCCYLYSLGPRPVGMKLSQTPFGLWCSGLGLSPSGLEGFVSDVPNDL